MPPLYDNIGSALALTQDGGLHSIELDNTGATLQTNEATLGEGQPSIWATFDLSGYSNPVTVFVKDEWVSGALAPYCDFYYVNNASWDPLSPDFTKLHFLPGVFLGDGSQPTATSPANDTCAAPTLLRGTSGTLADDNTRSITRTFQINPGLSATGVFYIFLGDWNAVDSGVQRLTWIIPATPGDTPADGLGGEFAANLKNILFYKCVAPADGYLEVTISKPGGSTIGSVKAGVEFGPACGSLVVETDDLLGQATFNGALPGVIGHQVSAGQAAYLEITAFTPGVFQLDWVLREIINYDAPDETVQVGPHLALPGTTPSLDSPSYPNPMTVLSYQQTLDGRHWLGWSEATATVDPSPGARCVNTAEIKASVLAADGSGSWADTTIATVDHQCDCLEPTNDQFYDLRGPLAGGDPDGPWLVSDGTELWAITRWRNARYDVFIECWVTDGIIPGHDVYHLDPLSMTWSLIGSLDTPGSYTLFSFFSASASPNEPGVVYVGASYTDNGDGLFRIAKFDTTTRLWQTDTLTGDGTVATCVARLWNEVGAPTLFHSPRLSAGAGCNYSTTLNMYSIDPTTGAATLLQTLIAPASFGTVGLSAHWLDVGVPKYLVSVLGAGYYYQVPCDGSAAFDYMDGLIAHYGPANPYGGYLSIFRDTDDVWSPTAPNMEQFDRVCFDGWIGATPPAITQTDRYGGAGPVRFGGGAGVNAPEIFHFGSDFWATAGWQASSGESFNAAIYKITVNRDVFCELGPEVVVPTGPILRGRFRLS